MNTVSFLNTSCSASVAALMYGLSVPTTQAGPLLHDLDVGLNALGRELLHEVRELLEHVVRILVGHQAHGNLGRGSGRDHGLRAGSDKSAGHAVDFERGARPGAIEHRVAGLAGEHGGADFGLAIVLLVERQPLPGFEFGFAGSLHALVKAGDQNFALGVLQLG